MQQDSADDGWLAWAQGLPSGLWSNDGPQALAVLLTAGWSALATLARESEESAVLGQQLHESMERLREEITRPVEISESLLDWARHLLLSGRLLQPLPANFDRVSPQVYPCLGPLQKEQANLDALQRALEDYRAAALHYAHALSELAEAALNEYQRELSACARTEAIARTTRERHDRWIRVAERTYERFLGLEDHTRAIGGLMNAWADLQLALRPVVDGVLRHTGLPSRRDLDDIQRHLDRLRRQQQADITRLERELTTLRNELDARCGEAPDSPLKPGSRKGDRS